MKQDTGFQALPVLAALGKGAAYLLLFLGSQTLVSASYITAQVIVMVISQGIVNPVVLVEYIYGKSTEITLVSGLITLAVVVLIYLIRRKKLSQALTIHRVPVGTLAPAMALIPGLYLIIVIALSLLPESWMADYAQASSALEGTGLLPAISTVLVAPLAEEVIFRGLIQSRLGQVMPGGLAVVLTAAVFGICHGQIIWTAYAFLLGLIWGLTAWRCGSIVPSILMHMLFNGLSQLAVELSQAGVSSLVWLAGVAVVAVAACALTREGIARLLGRWEPDAAADQKGGC